MSKRKKKVGLPPGSVVYTGSIQDKNIDIHFIQYDEEHLEEKAYSNLSKIVFLHSSEVKVDWYDVRGIHDTALIEQIGKTYDIHSLILEDVSDIHQRPKYEEYKNGIFLIAKALKFDKTSLSVGIEQVSLYFKKGFVVSFQETETDLFLAVRKRIQNDKGKIRLHGADYLVFAILDIIVDNYFIVLEDIEVAIESLEERIIETQESSIKSEIHHLKKELLVVRKSISPLREAISRLSKTDSPIVERNTEIYLRNVYEHTIHLMDTVDTYRDVLNGLQDLFISEVSFKMNQVMQVLTIVSTIFIPLTFLAGIYGMNFQNIPELSWQYGYFALWAIMIIIFIGLLIFFKRKHWF